LMRIVPHYLLRFSCANELEQFIFFTYLTVIIIF
jgi:hypothetical protein